MVNNLKIQTLSITESFDKNSLNYLREILKKSRDRNIKVTCFLIQFLIFSYNQMIMNIYTLN